MNARPRKQVKPISRKALKILASIVAGGEPERGYGTAQSIGVLRRRGLIVREARRGPGPAKGQGGKPNPIVDALSSKWVPIESLHAALGADFEMRLAGTIALGRADGRIEYRHIPTQAGRDEITISGSQALFNSTPWQGVAGRPPRQYRIVHHMIRRTLSESVNSLGSKLPGMSKKQIAVAIKALLDMGLAKRFQ